MLPRRFATLALRRCLPPPTVWCGAPRPLPLCVHQQLRFKSKGASPPAAKKGELPTNAAIKEPKIRLIDENQQNVGIVSTHDALARAKNANLDLVQLQNSSPPICKIMSYKEHLKSLEQKAKQREEISKAAKEAIDNLKMKTLRMSDRTDKHDVQRYVRQMRKFFEKNYAVRIEMTKSALQPKLIDDEHTVLEYIANCVEDVGYHTSVRESSHHYITKFLPNGPPKDGKKSKDESRPTTKPKSNKKLRSERRRQQQLQQQQQAASS